MNLFSRLFRVAKSYANSLVSSVEDPEKILDQAVADMQNDLIKMRQASAQVVAAQKRLQIKADQAQQAADDWYKRAELALGKGEEDLAREALKRKKSNQENADLLQKQLDGQNRAVSQLMQNMRMLESKLAEAKSKKDTLKARAISAKSAQAITDMVGSMNTTSALSAFERMEDKVLAMEGEAEAALQLVAPDNLESQFKSLEGDDVDNELAKMKQALGSGSSSRGAPKALPEGRPFKDAIDIELEKMRQNRSY